VDDFLEETTDTARTEVERIRDRVEAATNRAEEMLEIIHDGILAPINEITAITRGIRAGFDFLFRRRRKPSRDVPQSEVVEQGDDEEMFI